MPILTARLPVQRIKERWATYAEGIDAAGVAMTRGREGATATRKARYRRNVYVAESDAQAEDELAALLVETRTHMMHVREAYNPPDFQPEAATLNAWTDPKVADSEAIPFVLKTGSLYGSPARVREQVAELRDVGVQHLLCQTGFGAMSHEQNIASMRRFGEQVMPAFDD